MGVETFPGCVMQIIGKFHYEDVIFTVDSEEIRAKLASEAIKKTIAKNADMILYVPESLVTQIANDVDEAAKYIEDPQSLEEAAREKIREKLSVKEDFKVKIIQSAGVYFGENQKYKVEFANTLDNIIVYLFLDLLGIRDSEIFIDISTGQNFYIVALLEAARHLLVHKKLEKIFDRKYTPRVRTSTITPYAQVKGRESAPTKLPIHFSEIDVKVFFEYPLKTTMRRRGCDLVSIGDYLSPKLKDAERGELTRELYRKFGKDYNKVKALARLCMLAYNAFKYNTPLCFYGKGIINLNECDADEAFQILIKILGEIESMRKVVVEGDTLSVTRVPLCRGPIINTLLTLALFKSIKENLNDLNEKEAVNLAEFREKFKNIYEALGLQLNSIFLQKEINNIEMLSVALKDGEEKSYGELLEHPPGGAQDAKRNFFAHAGLTYDAVLVKREDGEIKIRYDPAKYEIIKDYLSECL